MGDFLSPSNSVSRLCFPRPSTVSPLGTWCVSSRAPLLPAQQPVWTRDLYLSCSLLYPHHPQRSRCSPTQRTFTEWLEERLQLDSLCGLGAQQVGLLFPGLPVGRGLSVPGGGCWPPEGRSAVVPGSGKVAWGNQEKVWLLPESIQHLFPQGRLGKCFEQVHKREERAGCIFPSFSICCLPFSPGIAGLWSPCPLPSCLAACVSAVVSPGLREGTAFPLAISPVLFRSYPPGIGSQCPGHRISAHCGPAGYILQPVPGQPGQSGLIFNPCFHLTQQMLPKALGRGS